MKRPLKGDRKRFDPQLMISACGWIIGNQHFLVFMLHFLSEIYIISWSTFFFFHEIKDGHNQELKDETTSEMKSFLDVIVFVKIWIPCPLNQSEHKKIIEEKIFKVKG